MTSHLAVTYLATSLSRKRPDTRRTPYVSHRNKRHGRSVSAEAMSGSVEEASVSRNGEDGDAPGSSTPLWQQVHQYHVVLAIAALLMISSLVVLAQGDTDEVSPMWVPILSGGVLSFGTFILSSDGERGRLSQSLLVGSLLLTFGIAVLYMAHLLGARSDPLAIINPWGYSLAFATISLPILSIDLTHRAPREIQTVRIGLAFLVPLGVFPLGLLISPVIRVVAATFSLAAFLLLVDALLKATSPSHVTSETVPGKGGSPSSETSAWKAPPKAGEQVNLNAIFDSHKERMNLHDDLMERALVVSHGISAQSLLEPTPVNPPPLMAPPPPRAAEVSTPVEPVRALPVGELAKRPEEDKQGPIYFAAGDEIPGRLSTGIERLDMLLKGGLPNHSQSAIIGPIFIGKEVVLHTFLAAGLARGEQVLIITSSRGAMEVSKALSAYLPNFEALSKSGYVQWVDAYAGEATRPAMIPNLTVVAGPGDYEGILVGVARAIAVFRGRAFRVAYISLSNSLMQADERKAFDFLRSLQGILRDAEATTAYAVDSGVMDDRQLAELQTMMDGSLLFKHDGNRTFLSAAGLGDVVTHQWVEYQRTGKTLTMGSFALERIR